MTAHTNVGLQVHINGNAVASYAHEGRTYVEAREGTEYALHLKNNNPFRVKAVLSVDGVNVVNGDAATGDRDETGYILEPYQSTTIKGYRLDNDSVAAFRFVKAEGGYAKAEKGMTGTTGVIGLRVWREKPPAPAPAPAPIIKEVHHHHHDYWRDWVWPAYPSQPWRQPIWYSSAQGSTLGSLGDGTMFRCASNASLDSTPVMMNCSTSLQMGQSNMQSAATEINANPFDAGSTFGAKVESKVTLTAFTADILLGEHAIYYAFKAGLTALGVDTTRVQKVAFPQAFGSFCKPPSGWQG